MKHNSFRMRGTRLGLGLLTLAFALAALGASVAHAATGCNVPSTAYPTIQAAVNDAACATINVAAGTYYENVSISRDVTLRGAGQDKTIVDGGGTGTVFTINGGNTVTLKGVTIRNGSALLGAGIFNDFAWLTLQNSTLSGNSAGDRGGGIFNNLGTVSLTRTTLVNNTPDNCFNC